MIALALFGVDMVDVAMSRKLRRLRRGSSMLQALRAIEMDRFSFAALGLSFGGGRQMRCETSDRWFRTVERRTVSAVHMESHHFILVSTHPYMDGNGHTGRTLKNVMLTAMAGPSCRFSHD